ncbi:hypothetical protein N9M21_04695 [Alphaproteobacteria bacterium]|nr:hypothetical protein [Alphaproteobacteria bacterium]
MTPQNLKYTPEIYEAGIKYLRANLSEFNKLYLKIGYIDYEVYDFNFHSLVRTIVGQQLSGKAAATILSRLTSHNANKTLTPENTVNFSLSTLMNIGLSRNKSEYILSIAQKSIDGELQFQAIAKLSREECFQKLISLRGIGPWSASILMMFNLGFLDEFPENDVTLNKAIEKYFPTLTGAVLDQKARPYRSIICLYLWRFIDDFT